MESDLKKMLNTIIENQELIMKKLEIVKPEKPKPKVGGPTIIYGKSTSKNRF